MRPTLTRHSPAIWHVHLDGALLGSVFRLTETSRPTWTARTTTGRVPQHQFDQRAHAVDWLVIQHRPPYTARRPPQDAVLAAITAAAAAGRPDTGALVAAGAIIELAASLKRQRATTGAAPTWAALDRISAWATAVCSAVQAVEVPSEVPRELHAVVHEHPAASGGTEAAATSRPTQVTDVPAISA